MSISEYEENVKIERKFTPTMKGILGKQFIGQDPVADKREATDFLTFNIKPIRVAARLRTYYYYKNRDYREQFTIRWSLQSGAETEIHKLRKGFVQFMLYGFIDESKSQIIRYSIIDLSPWPEGKEPSYLGPFQNPNTREELVACWLKDVNVIKNWTHPEFR